jgi:hypothetical protein
LGGGDRPDAVVAKQLRGELLDEGGELAFEGCGFAAGEFDLAAAGAKREQCAAQLRLLARAWAQRDAAFDKRTLWLSLQPFPQLGRCGQDERAQLVEAAAADRDRGR